MKTKSNFWCELVVAAVAADREGGWEPHKLADYIDGLIVEAEKRECISAPITETQALRRLEAVIRANTKENGELIADEKARQAITAAMAVIDRARQG